MYNLVKKINFLYILFGFLFVLMCCENPITGYGPQPVYINKSEFKPSLNIFGILRPDHLQGYPASFIHIEEIFPIASSHPDNFDIKDATVTVYSRQEAQLADTVHFLYTNFDSVFSRYEYRPENFIPAAGRMYTISCVKEGYPVLTGSTIVPGVPVIANDTIYIDNNNIDFEIMPDSLVALYDIFLASEEYGSYNLRVRKPETGNIQVRFDNPFPEIKNGRLIIYAYDKNLSEYLTYNISIKPNTYQGRYSTVENGHGCFGSLNILSKTIDLNE